jgi:sugar lactone lactonase YvrE
MLRGWMLLWSTCLVAACHWQWGPHDTPHQGPELESVAQLSRRPTAVAIDGDGRLFVNFPNWWSQPRYAVALVADDGALTPYPDAAWNAWDGQIASAPNSLVCVQALYIDRCADTLWIVDAGNPLRTFGAVVPGAPKLLGVDLASGKVAHTIRFDDNIAPAQSYLNDVRVDRQTSTAYLTDSGMGALIVVDLSTGKSRRVLADHRSTKAEACVVPRVGGRDWRAIGGASVDVHADGIALGPNAEWLYFHALSGRTLYRIATSLLRDPSVSDEQLAAAVQSLGQTSAVDGMWMDLDGQLYLTAIEHDAIERRNNAGKLEVIVRDGLIQWPDSITIAEVAGKRHLYFTASQIHKSWPFNGGIDVSTTPFEIFRVPIGPATDAPETRQCAARSGIRAQGR